MKSQIEITMSTPTMNSLAQTKTYVCKPHAIVTLHIYPTLIVSRARLRRAF